MGYCRMKFVVWGSRVGVLRYLVVYILVSWHGARLGEIWDGTL